MAQNVPNKFKLNFLCNKWLYFEETLLTNCSTQTTCLSFVFVQVPGQPKDFGGAQIIYWAWNLRYSKRYPEREIFAIPSDILQSVASNFGMRLQKIVKVEGKHIEHIVI
jgi:hypothetical protein